MLTSANRLTKVRDFNLLMKNGRWVSGRFIDLKFLPLVSAPIPRKENPDNFKKQLRLATTAGLKISKSAVVRNRAKRQMREVVRLLLKDKKLRVGHYILFVAKKAILEKNYAEISDEIKLLLKRSGIFVG